MGFVTIAGNFSGTDIGEIERVKKKDNIFASVVREANFFERMIRQYCNRLEFGS